MRNLDEINHLLAETEEELARLNTRRAELLTQITQLQQEKALLLPMQETPLPPARLSSVTNQSPQEAKIALFRSLFRGREDVYPKRFESLKTGKQGYAPVCRNEWVSGICEKPKIRCEDCRHRAFLPVTDNVVRNHLLGMDSQDRSGRDFTIGVYPMLLDESCWFLAADFDKASWQEDAGAFLETCRHFNVPAALERSRSGNGGHAWIFFSEPVPAALARKMGAFLLTQTMERRPEIGLDSYDRFFPSQDTLPRGGFGNLIALPLQKKPREQGHSLFLDENFVPYQDQWAFLSSLRRMNRQEVEAMAAEAEKQGEFLGIRIPVTDESNDAPWAAPPSRQHKNQPVIGPLPEQIDVVFGNQVYVPKADITPSLRNRLIRLAAFQNPEFYQAQAMRMSTFGKPRIISCCEDFPKHLGLPRGCLDELLNLFQSLQVKVRLTDQRFGGTPLELQFHGVLRAEQQQAADALLPHEIGVLSASTAFGKTVVAAYLMAQRQVNTLVIVHRRQLLDQWVEVLSQFLDLAPKEIGQIGGGKHQPTEKIDVAMVQSLVRKGVVDDIVGKYGYFIVDECHHISAVSFEQVVRQSKARYLTGLSATVVRKDGHHPIVFMQCGPIRYRVDDRKQAEKRPFDHKVIVRPTTFHLPLHLQNVPSPPIQEVYALLARDDKRNHLIIQDVIAAVQANRFPVLLTERREHLDLLASLLAQHIQNVIVMTGGMGKKQRKQLAEQIASIPADQPRVIVATGRYLGEGFDDERLDTLFLALPISWRGTLTQYAGRLHRLNVAKKEVVIYDYVDFEVPMLAKMHARRRTGYKAIGYEIVLLENKSQGVQLKLEKL
ncbi:MAG: DEAD/DEAH box helicase family protein [Chloroflexi bacterium]|nr:DEAD/DEAH box helicase family protein [Chloroflexota bacterium]